MSSSIQVLVVDDAIVIRSILRKELSDDPAIDVMDVAANGRIALRKIEACVPDLVVLDLEMPEMNGMETLLEIRKKWPKLPVVIFSGETENDARTALSAMAEGATAALSKPSSLSKIGNDQGSITAELALTIKSICQPVRSLERSRASSQDAAARAVSVTESLKTRAIEIVAIGASTGGPNALEEVLGALPAELPVPVVVVQHMPATFTKHLADRLDRSCAVSVAEGVSGAEIKPGCVYIAPGGYHMVLEGKRGNVTLALNEDPPESSCRPAVDPMLRSVAKIYGDASLTAILTGMGSDGLEGCKQVNSVGGRILVQDEETSVVWGMPGYVSQAGLADSELPLEQVGPSIARWCRRQPRTAVDSSTQVEVKQLNDETKMNKNEANKGRPALVVDDSRAVRSLLTRLLRELGFEPHEAGNGVEALEKIQSGIMPELALVDWNMPEMNGMELLEALRKRSDLDDLKIVMVTSETDVEFIQKALEAGADEYVMKPFSKEDLIARLTQIGILDS